MQPPCCHKPINQLCSPRFSHKANDRQVVLTTSFSEQKEGNVVAASSQNRPLKQLVLTTRSAPNSLHSVGLCIVSQAVLVDRSGLQALICSQSAKGVSMVRSTCSPRPSKVSQRCSRTSSKNWLIYMFIMAFLFLIAKLKQFTCPSIY